MKRNDNDWIAAWWPMSPCAEIALGLLLGLVLLLASFCSHAQTTAHHNPPPPVTTPAPAAPPPFVDNWGGWRAHLGISAAMGAAGILVFPDQPAAVFAACLTPGLVRELRQRRQPGNGFSWRDMAANAVGCGLGEIAGGAVSAAVDPDGRTWALWQRPF